MKRLLVLLEKTRLTTLLACGFGVLALITLSIGVSGLLGLRFLNEEVQVLYDNQLQSISQLKEAQINLAHMGRAVRQFVLAQNNIERDRARNGLSDTEIKLHQALDAVRSRVDADNSVLQLSSFDERYAVYKRNLEKTIALYERDHFNSAEGQALLSSTDFQLVAIDANQMLNTITRQKEETARLLAQNAQHEFEASRKYTAILLAGGLALSLLLAFLISVSIRRPTRRLSSVVDELAAGRLDLDVPLTDYPNEIGHLARGIEVVKSGAREMQLQRWVKTHEAEIAANLQGATHFVDLAQRFFSVVGPLLKLGHGAFYIHEEQQRRLRLLNAYAWRERKNLNQHFQLGEGLVGQCALERSPIIITQPPADYIQIGSSLGQATPGCIMVLPIINQQRLLGVIELASFKPFASNEQALLDSILPVLAMSLEIFERNARTQQLLEQKQEESETVEEQALLLQHQNVALEARQTSLADTEAWYRGILESAPDGIIVIDKTGHIILSNLKACTQFGYEASELLGQNIEMLVPSNSRRVHAGLHKAWISTPQASRPMGALGDSLKGLRKDGTEFTVDISLSRLPSIGGREQCVCATIRSIDKHQKIEKGLRESDSRMCSVLDKSPAGVAIVAADGKPIYTNQRLASMLGISLDDLKTRRSSEFWAKPEDQLQLMARMERDGVVNDFATTFRRADGELRDVLLSASKLELPDGHYMVSWFYDVTDTKAGVSRNV